MASACEFFYSAATAAFDFLTKEHQFWEVERSSGRNECWLTLRSETVGFRIAYEIGSEIWVDILRLSPQRSSIVVEARSSLDMLLDERDQTADPRAPEGTLDSEDGTREALQRAAAKLRQFGADIIRGDFQVFPRLKQREAENLRRRNEQLFGPESDSRK